MRWIVFPGSRPKNINVLLENRGFKKTFLMDGMYFEVPNDIPQASPGVTIEELSWDNLDEYVMTALEGFRRENEPITQERINLSKLNFEKRLRERDERKGSFLARLNGQPAATGAIHIFPNAGYFMGSSVRPTFRSKGLYRSLVFHRLSLLRDQGIQLALIHARCDTSAPICKRLGFHSLFQSVQYELDAKKD